MSTGFRMVSLWEVLSHLLLVTFLKINSNPKFSFPIVIWLRILLIGIVTSMTFSVYGPALTPNLKIGGSHINFLNLSINISSGEPQSDIFWVNLYTHWYGDQRIILLSPFTQTCRLPLNDKPSPFHSSFLRSISQELDTIKYITRANYLDLDIDTLVQKKANRHGPRCHH